MAVRDALLVLLASGPRYGYQLKSEFEAATGNGWPLNIGQVYSTLQRLERDELVVVDGDPDDDGRQSYVLTAAGRFEVDAWFTQTTPPSESTRDEATMKVLLAVASSEVGALGIVGAERVAAMEHLQQVTALKARGSTSLAAQLHLDRTVLLADARVRWLDLVEQRLEASGEQHSQPVRHQPASTPTSPNPLKEIRS